MSLVIERPKLEALQTKRLGALLTKVRRKSDFYRDRLERSGLDAGKVSLAEFVEKMPFTTKMDLVWDREEFPPYGSNLTEPMPRYSRLCQSSGTTRGPLPFIDTAESWSAMLDCWDKVYEASGTSSDDKIFFAFSFGPFLGFWTAFESATRRGNLAIPGGGLGSQARLQAMVTNQIDVLCCTPTYAMRLGEIFSAHENDEIAAYRLRKIIVAGEAGGCIPEVRRRISDLWKGAQVYDHHGMSETGPISYEDPEHPMGLCVIEEAYFTEIIDYDTQREVEVGQQGELVITNLTRTASPLLRYRTGDLVEKSYYTPPGSREPILCLEGGILGRVDEMVVIRGVNVYPTAVEKIIRSFPEIIEFQILESTKQAMAELEVLIEAERSAKSDLAMRVQSELAEAFALRIPVSIVENGELPRFEFKSKRWVRQ